MKNVIARAKEATSKGGNDSKYFTTTKKGEIHELKEQLHNPKQDKQKEAVKKVRTTTTCFSSPRPERRPPLRAIQVVCRVPGRLLNGLDAIPRRRSRLGWPTA